MEDKREEAKIIEVKDLIDELDDILFSKSIVTQLVEPDISEYERGVHAGKLYILGWLKSKVIPKEEVKEKVEDTKVRHRE